MLTPPSPIPKKHIFVIEDEPLIRATLQRYCTMMGYDFTSVATGPNALRMLENLKPDLIFLDITLPDMDGLAVLGQLHEKHEDLRVIMMANVTDIQKATMSLNYGAGDYITKPLDLSTFKRIVQIHLPK